ncbi:uncharacterized protein L201_005176 [Kwoniella dendrophila CBS 6074]|uniref:Uncharacterized protein n=1 Tax=Kwoniella dendrophila CBS 6074 TaxID=1295534 RepID=A0AAX4JZH2_9TREE
MANPPVGEEPESVEPDQDQENTPLQPIPTTFRGPDVLPPGFVALSGPLPRPRGFSPYVFEGSQFLILPSDHVILRIYTVEGYEDRDILMRTLPRDVNDPSSFRLTIYQEYDEDGYQVEVGEAHQEANGYRHPIQSVYNNDQPNRNEEQQNANANPDPNPDIDSDLTRQFGQTHITQNYLNIEFYHPPERQFEEEEERSLLYEAAPQPYSVPLPEDYIEDSPEPPLTRASSEESDPRHIRNRSSPDVPQTPSSGRSPPSSPHHQPTSSPTFQVEQRPPITQPASPPVEITAQRLDESAPSPDVQEETNDPLRLRGGGTAYSVIREVQDDRHFYAQARWDNAYRERQLSVESLPNDPPMILPNFAQKRAEFLAEQAAAAERRETENFDWESYRTCISHEVDFEQHLRLRGGGEFDSDSQQATGSSSFGERQPQNDLISDVPREYPHHERSAPLKGLKTVLPVLPYPFPKGQHSNSEPPAASFVKRSGSIAQLDPTAIPPKAHSIPKKSTKRSVNPFKAILKHGRKLIEFIIRKKSTKQQHAVQSQSSPSPERHGRSASETERSDVPTTPLTTQPCSEGGMATSPISYQDPNITTPTQDAQGYSLDNNLDRVLDHAPHNTPGDNIDAELYDKSGWVNQEHRQSIGFAAMTDPGSGSINEPADTHPSAPTVSKNDPQVPTSTTARDFATEARLGPSHPAGTNGAAPTTGTAVQPVQPTNPAEPSQAPSQPAARPSTGDDHPRRPNLRTESDTYWYNRLLNRNPGRRPRYQSETNTAATREHDRSTLTAVRDQPPVENIEMQRIPTPTHPDTPTVNNDTDDVPQCPFPRFCGRQPNGQGQSVAMERSSGQGPSNPVRPTERQLIRRIERAFPCLKPKKDKMKAELKETAGEANEEDEEVVGKGKGKAGEPKRKRRFGNDPPPADEGNQRKKDDGDDNGDNDGTRGGAPAGPSGSGSGGGTYDAGPSGSSASAAADESSGNGEERREPEDSKPNEEADPTMGDHPPHQPSDSTKNIGEQRQNNPANFAGATRSNMSFDKFLNSGIDTTITSINRPQPSTEATSSATLHHQTPSSGDLRGDALSQSQSSQQSLKPPRRSRLNSEGSNITRPKSATLPPDPAVSEQPKLPTVPSIADIASTEMVKSSSGVSGKTFGKGAQTPGTGQSGFVPPVPSLPRTDEGMLSTQPTGNDQGTSYPVMNYPDKNLATPEHNGRRNQSVPQTPSPYAASSALPSPQLQQEGSPSVDQSEEPGLGPSESLVHTGQITPQTSQQPLHPLHTPPLYRSSPPDQSPLSSGGPSPSPLTTNTQLPHPLPVPTAEISPTMQHKLQATDTLENISEASHEGLSSSGTHGSLATSSESSSANPPSPSNDPMASLGQAAEIATGIGSHQPEEKDEKAHEGYTIPQQASSTEGEMPRPSTPITKDTQFDQEAESKSKSSSGERSENPMKSSETESQLEEHDPLLKSITKQGYTESPAQASSINCPEPMNPVLPTDTTKLPINPEPSADTRSIQETMKEQGRSSDTAPSACATAAPAPTNATSSVQAQAGAQQPNSPPPTYNGGNATPRPPRSEPQPFTRKWHKRMWDKIKNKLKNKP